MRTKVCQLRDDIPSEQRPGWVERHHPATELGFIQRFGEKWTDGQSWDAQIQNGEFRRENASDAVAHAHVRWRRDRQSRAPFAVGQARPAAATPSWCAHVSIVDCERKKQLFREAAHAERTLAGGRVSCRQEEEIGCGGDAHVYLPGLPLVAHTRRWPRSQPSHWRLP